MFVMEYLKALDFQRRNSRKLTLSAQKAVVVNVLCSSASRGYIDDVAIVVIGFKVCSRHKV